MIRFFVLALALFGAPFFACATNVTPSGSVLVQQTGTNVYSVVDGSGGSSPFSLTSRTIGGPSAGAVTVAEGYAGTLAGSRISILARRAVPAAFAISAAKESFLLGCQAGTELSQYLGLGTPANGSRVGCNVTDWLFDEGQSPPSENGTLYRVIDSCKSDSTGCVLEGQSLYTQWSDAGSACRQYAGSFTGGTGTGLVVNGSCQWKVVNSTGSVLLSGTSGFYTKSGNVSKGCPAVIDSLDPAYNIPEGSQPGPDGKCATGRYSKISAEEAKRLMEAYANIAHAASVLQKILDKGGNLQGAPERTVTGDPQAVGTPTTTTTTNPDGSVTTTTVTPTTNYNYSGNQITVTNSSSSTTQTCTAAGSCSTTTTSSNNDQSSASPTDTGMPPVPNLYTQKYPDGLSGVWNEKKAAVEQSALFTWLRSLVPTFGDGGCPTWILPVDVLNIHTSGDISIPCWLWGTIKLIFNISALLVARRLIFGG